MSDITKRTFSFALRIIKLCQVLNKQYVMETNVLAKQLLRSGTSIGANVEEAQAGQSRSDFVHKMAIALKEARETNYWLRLLEASEILPKEKLTELLKESDEIKKIIGAIIVSSKK
ncbi:MAG TPA: four helix bundle protein [Pyrinomonadaceae bacterium]|nr:four helix bundle protein [Pyrinomonadaceae bacterium]